MGDKIGSHKASPRARKGGGSRAANVQLVKYPRPRPNWSQPCRRADCQLAVGGRRRCGGTAALPVKPCGAAAALPVKPVRLGLGHFLGQLQPLLLEFGLSAQCCVEVGAQFDQFRVVGGVLAQLQVDRLNRRAKLAQL